MGQVKRKAGFRPGTSGACEASLYEFSEISTAGNEACVMRVAAVTLEEAMTYVRETNGDFQIGRIEFVGMVRLVSGSPVD